MMPEARPAGVATAVVVISEPAELLIVTAAESVTEPPRVVMSSCMEIVPAVTLMSPRSAIGSSGVDRRVTVGFVWKLTVSALPPVMVMSASKRVSTPWTLNVSLPAAAPAGFSVIVSELDGLANVTISPRSESIVWMSPCCVTLKAPSGSAFMLPVFVPADARLTNRSGLTPTAASVATVI